MGEDAVRRQIILLSHGRQYCRSSTSVKIYYTRHHMVYVSPLCGYVWTMPAIFIQKLLCYILEHVISNCCVRSVGEAVELVKEITVKKGWANGYRSQRVTRPDCL